jgi:hypothetical protein
MLLTRIIDDARLKGCERVRLDSHRPGMTTAIRCIAASAVLRSHPGPDLGGENRLLEKCLDDTTGK